MAPWFFGAPLEIFSLPTRALSQSVQTFFLGLLSPQSPFTFAAFNVWTRITSSAYVHVAEAAELLVVLSLALSLALPLFMFSGIRVRSDVGDQMHLLWGVHIYTVLIRKYWLDNNYPTICGCTCIYSVCIPGWPQMSSSSAWSSVFLIWWPRS